MGKETIFIKVEKLYTRVIGLMEKSKGLVSLLLKIIMDIVVNGRIIKNKVKVAISTRMDKNMTDNG
jgi:hypothetical protein